MNRAVPDYGPYDAPLLIVGEAGGKEEGAKGRPFVGATGRKVRELIAAAGLDPERQRYANVIPVEMPMLPKTPAGMHAVVRAHWHSIEATLLRGNHQAVLAYGRAALWRLSGRTKITDEHGATNHIEIGGRQVPLVTSIHPAAIMRSKIEAGWTLVRAATDRACRYANGSLVYDAYRQQPTHEHCYDETRAMYIRERCNVTGAHIAIDTEFDRVTKVPFIIGVTCDGEHVFSFVPTPESIKGLRYLLNDSKVTKVFHHAPADTIALAKIGINVRPPIMDTLMLYATVFPDLPVGLEHAALHRFDHWHAWKDMTHDDPRYNAIDVVGTWRLYPDLAREAIRHDLWGTIDREVRHVSVLCMAMEARGLAVDPVAQRAAVDANEAECTAIKDEVTREVAAVFAKRRVPFERRLVEVAGTLESIVQPRLRKDRDPLVDAQVAALRKERNHCITVVKRWTQGFNLGNNDHLRWLLYDADGFKLPVQKIDGHPTANSDAIARLLALKRVQESPTIKMVLAGVKAYQHAKRMTNTFLLWNEGDEAVAPGPSGAVDRQGFAHPEYRPFGTGTGRLAGGPDTDLGDRTTNPYAYNAMNIPEKTRIIYVPHPATFAVDVGAVATEITDDGLDLELAVSDL